MCNDIYFLYRVCTDPYRLCTYAVEINQRLRQISKKEGISTIYNTGPSFD